MAEKVYSKTVQGARASVFIDGKVVAFLSGVNYSENIERTPVFTIGRLNAWEYAPTAYTCNATATTWRIPGYSAKSLGFMQKLDSILKEPRMVIAIYDNTDTVTPLFVMEDAVCTGQDGGLNARGEMTEVWRFVGIRAYDESGSTGQPGPTALIAE